MAERDVAAGLLIGPRGTFEHLSRVADLDPSSPTRGHATLFHHRFELRTPFGTHTFHSFIRVRHFLAVHFVLALDLPQSRLIGAAGCAGAASPGQRVQRRSSGQ